MKFVEDDTLLNYKPEVVILICCKNSGENIKHTIKSIFDSTKYPFKLILIDAESNDGTDKVIDTWAEQFPEKVIAYHIKDCGFIGAINYGLKKAGDLDVYLTQDDVIFNKLYKRDWLQILATASKIEDAGLVTTINGGGVSGPTYIDGLNWVGTWSMFIPKKTRDKIKYYEEI